MTGGWRGNPRSLENLTGRAEPGNQRRLVHGATGELAVAPLRAELDRELAAEFPGLHPARRAILADRQARLVLIRRFIDARGGLLRDEGSGEGWPILKYMSAWENAVDATVRELEEEARAVTEGDGVRRLIEDGRRLREASGE